MVKKEGVSSGDNSFGIVSVVFGTLSILSLSVGGIAMGIIGLLFALKAKKRANNKWAKWGFWLSVTGIVLGVLAIYFLVNYLSGYLGQIQGLPA